MEVCSRCPCALGVRNSYVDIQYEYAPVHRTATFRVFHYAAFFFTTILLCPEHQERLVNPLEIFLQGLEIVLLALESMVSLILGLQCHRSVARLKRVSRSKPRSYILAVFHDLVDAHPLLSLSAMQELFSEQLLVHQRSQRLNCALLRSHTFQ